MSHRQWWSVSGLRLPAILVALLVLLVIAVPGSLAHAAATTNPGELDRQPNPAIPAAVTNTLRIRVVSARTSGAITQGQVVPNFQFIIVRDDTGNPTQARTPGCSPATDPNYPANCEWPSIKVMSGGSAGQVVTQGSQTNLNETTGIILPNGRYMISVTAEGFKIDGAWFTVPLADPGLITVSMQPHPLPLGTLRIQVFEDSMTNGQYDPNSGERGLAGFVAHLDDVLGEVTTDWFGNPLCTRYDAGGNPIPGSGGQCVSDVNGLITIPNLGPNRYAVFVVPPNGQTWIQTTTLEGGHDWDVWLHENYTGYDPEMIVGGEQVPEAVFGYVQPRSLPASGAAGRITGRAMGIREYVQQAGGSVPEGPVARPWVALTNLLTGDTLIYAAQGNADGTFDIQNVPNGDYQLAVWDAPQLYLLQLQNVTVQNGQTVNVGDMLLAHWFGTIEGTVFIDTNENGRRDPGEAGLPGQSIALKTRENSLVDQGSNSTVTDNQGRYVMNLTYEYGWWNVLEVYNDRFFTTGVTWQTDNQPTETTVLGAGVDVAVYNLAGLRTRVDWGVRPYAPGTNGGIVGTVVYNATRNELDARFSATEDYEGGIPNLTVNLYAPVPCTLDPGDPTCAPNPNGLGGYRTNPDGSFTRGPLLNTYLTETFTRPTDCVARTSTGVPLSQAFLPPSTGGFDCLEAPVMGNQVQTGFSSVNGNYGFTTILADPVTGAPIPESPMPPGEYLVEVVVPNDAFGRPLFKVTKEEDINVFGGDQFAPQVPPPPCVGPLHTVRVVGDVSQALFDPFNPSTTSGVYNPSFLDAGGSPYEGQRRPLCNMLLVTVQNGKSIAPIFSYFTDVPLPGRLFGTVFNDLALSVNPQDLWYGEKAGIPNIPVGIYDYSGRYITTLTSDPNGTFEILLPSTATYNCPLPAGPCPGVYRLVSNDPGQPGRPNPNYNPYYRTLVTNWQIWPNLTLLADAALVSSATVLEFPGTQTVRAAQCQLAATTPQLFAVSPRPYVTLPANAAARTFTISGQGFGATQNDGRVMLDNVVLDINSWNDREISARVPDTITPGAYQLQIIAGNGQRTVNGLTFHVRGNGYTPTVFEVGPGRTYATVQAALEAAANTARALVVVYPNTPGQFTPLGDYYENIVIHSPVKLQGVGPGGTRADGTFVPGSILNGLGFGTLRAPAWLTLVAGLQNNPATQWSGNQNVYESEVIYVLARNGQFTPNYRAGIDGLTIRSGTEFGTPGPTPAFPAGVATQGGGILVNAYARNLQITNNVIWGNGGAYGGAIRVGTPYVGNNNNDNLRIANNRILDNGGTNLAGAIAIFTGSNNYEIANNDICGNFSAEYGAGISHFGLSPNGSIHHNRIYLNESYDEGAGIMIASELPANPAALPPGAGAVDIYDNIIEANLANDDGGGIRFLMAGNFPYNIYNNLIVNNVSTDEGGGIAIDDAPNVRIYNNTIMKNITTATAATSNGLPKPTGLSTSQNSAALQASLPTGSPIFSNPVLFNNIFWDNRAGRWNGTMLVGIGAAGDATPINYWDLGVADGSGLLAPTNSLLQEASTALHPYTMNASNVVGSNPQVVSPYDLTVTALPWRGEPNFIDNIIVALETPPNQMGNYHIANTSPAQNAGAQQRSGIFAPMTDLDGDYRPSFGGFEIGADERPGAFPVLDTFNRADGNVNSGGITEWRGNTNLTAFRVFNNRLQVRSAGYLYWNPTFGANQEAFFTFRRTSPTATRQGVLLKVDNLAANGSGPGPNTRFIEVSYRANTNSVTIDTLAPAPQGRVQRAAINRVNLDDGDQLGARAYSDGTVNVYKNGILLGSTNIATGANAWALAYVAGGGQIGLWFQGPLAPPNDARLDRFGGGTLPAIGPAAVVLVNVPTATVTATRTVTPTATITRTATVSATATLTRTATITPTATATRTITPTATRTITATLAPTATRTPTIAPTRTVTPTVAPTRTITPTLAPAVLPNPTRTITPTRTSMQFPSPTNRDAAQPEYAIANPVARWEMLGLLSNISGLETVRRREIARSLS
ncbi:MAG: IPT/TIG domain-containing protein [Chloroflexi bacterium]|nr:IPT/TIG domain-containing protein [Chloroflexota bacterium]